MSDRAWFIEVHDKEWGGWKRARQAWTLLPARWAAEDAARDVADDMLRKDPTAKVRVVEKPSKGEFSLHLTERDLAGVMPD